MGFKGNDKQGTVGRKAWGKQADLSGHWHKTFCRARVTPGAKIEGKTL